MFNIRYSYKQNNNKKSKNINICFQSYADCKMRTMWAEDRGHLPLEKQELIFISLLHCLWRCFVFSTGGKLKKQRGSNRFRATHTPSEMKKIFNLKLFLPFLSEYCRENSEKAAPGAARSPLRSKLGEVQPSAPARSRCLSRANTDLT